MSWPLRSAVVRTLIERAAADDYDGLLALLDPEVVWFGTRGGLDENQVLRGPQAVIRYMREIQEPWQRLDVEVERIIDTGDAVVALLREIGETRQGGPEMQDHTAMIFKVREEKIVEMTGYLDRDEALRAAGVA